MSSPDGRFHLTYNGEIFNFKELREELRSAGVEFRTSGDTEVLLNVLAHWGPEGLERLNGQFAFGFFDSEKRELMICRDRMGILPMFYAQQGSRFAFASEIKAMLTLPWIVPALNEDAVEGYLATRSTRAPETLFKGVCKLEPGCYAVIDDAGRTRFCRWWEVPAEREYISDRREATEELERLLRDAIKARLIADVPVGAFLSGGLDSSLITALVASLNEKPVTCFVAGFGDPRFDEVPYARAVAGHCGLELVEVTLDPAEYIAAFEKLIWNRDAPLSEPADVAVYTISKCAASRVKVMLSGEGADELFAGYPKHKYDSKLASVQRIPQQVRGPILRSIESHLWAGASRQRVALRALTARGREERWQAWFAPFTWYERRELKDGYGVAPEREPEVGRDHVNAMLRRDCGQWLSDNLLERGDRMSMAASIECRPPFMDHRLVELAMRIPGAFKVEHNVGKSILRDIARPIVPGAILERRKVGFKVPIDEWFRAGMRDYMLDNLTASGSFVASYFSRKAIEKICERHLSGKNEDLKIWTLLGLEVWSRRFLKQG